MEIYGNLVARHALGPLGPTMICLCGDSAACVISNIEKFPELHYTILALICELQCESLVTNKV